MRILALAIAVVLTAVPAAAQDDQQPLDRRVLDLPVSLERIREGLTSDKPSILDALDVQANFRVEVEEKRPSFVEMFSPESFKGGPVPPGGLYAYEQQRMLFPNSTPALILLSTRFRCSRASSMRSATCAVHGPRPRRAPRSSGPWPSSAPPSPMAAKASPAAESPGNPHQPSARPDNPTRESVAQVMQSRYA